MSAGGLLPAVKRGFASTDGQALSGKMDNAAGRTLPRIGALWVGGVPAAVPAQPFTEPRPRAVCLRATPPKVRATRPGVSDGAGAFSPETPA